MKKYLLLILFLITLSPDIIPQTIYLSTVSSKNELKKLKKKIISLNSELKNIRKSKINDDNIYRDKIDSLSMIFNNSYNSLTKDIKNYQLEIQKNEKNYKELVDNNYSTNKYIISLLILIIIAVIAVYFLGLRYYNIKNYEINHLIQNYNNKHDNKLSSLLSLMLSRDKNQNVQSSVVNSELVLLPEHSLALRVGEEIHRMRTRIETMDMTLKGLSSLNSSIRRLEDEFNNQGYEIVELKNLNYDTNMTVLAKNIVPVAGLKKGEQIIVKVIKPQILYKGVTLYHGDVEVGISELDVK
ncbi:MAG: hypothetical protein NTV87_15925 [Ignavibacteriae bacterium]|nr:hypothetical protein [Ignavibacteriota bacterium]